MRNFNRTFQISKPIIGMIHIDALPGAPDYNTAPEQIIEKALSEAKIYKDAGIDSIMIENMHDTPYLNGAGPEITAMMSVIGREVKKEAGLPCGLQILSGANRQALASAQAGGLDFIRAEGFVFSHIGDEGYFQSDAGELLRYRKQIDAENLAVFTDVKKKHASHSITSDISIEETSVAAEFFKSDGIVITGIKTGDEPDIAELKIVKNAVSLPVIIGSGITIDNIDKYFESADAFIVGSYFKLDGLWANEVNQERVKRFMDKVNKKRD